MRTFKVVLATTNGSYLSAIVYGNPCLVKEYSTEKWTTANVGGLLSFRTLKDAKRFWLLFISELNLEIWEANGKEKVPLGIHAMNLGNINTKDVEKHWQSGSSSSLGWPDGTVAHRRLRLIKKVWPIETN